MVVLNGCTREPSRLHTEPEECSRRCGDRFELHSTRPASARWRVVTQTHQDRVGYAGRPHRVDKGNCFFWCRVTGCTNFLPLEVHGARTPREAKALTSHTLQKMNRHAPYFLGSKIWRQKQATQPAVRQNTAKHTPYRG